MQINIILATSPVFGRQWCCSWNSYNRCDENQSVPGCSCINTGSEQRKPLNTVGFTAFHVTPKKMILEHLLQPVLQWTLLLRVCLEIGQDSQVAISRVKRDWQRVWKYYSYIIPITLAKQLSSLRSVTTHILYNLDFWKWGCRLYVGRYGLKFQINFGK